MAALSPALVAAHDGDRGIGRAGAIPRHLPADFTLFRRITLGHALVVGRATLESLPPRGLPGRRIVCVTRAASLPGADACEGDLGQAIARARALSPGGGVFVAGGAGIYAEAAGLVREAIVTEIPGRHGCDRFFPDLASLGWRRVEAIPVEGAAAWRWAAPA